MLYFNMEVQKLQGEMPMNNKNLLTVSQAAEYLQLKPNTVYKLVKAGKLRGFRTATGSIRISQSDLNAFLTPASPERKKDG